MLIPSRAIKLAATRSFNPRSWRRTSMLKARKEEPEMRSERAHGAAIPGVSAAPIPAATALVTDFLSRSDEAARKRLNRMSEKLRQLETQMEALEAEVSRAAAKDFSQPD